MSRTATVIPENETTNQRFCRLANMRVPKAVKSLELVENLYSSTQYNWSLEQSAAVIDTLTNVLNRIVEKSENSGKAVDKDVFNISAAE